MIINNFMRKVILKVLYIHSNLKRNKSSMTTLKKLENDLKSGRLSRRDFIKATSAFGLAVAAPGILSSSAFAAGPEKGGHLKIAMGHGSTTDSVDPATYTHAFTQTLGGAIYNYITAVQGDESLAGEIAESWETSKDAKVWTFKIRKGMKFHNGQAVTVNDVIASLKHHTGEDTKSGAKVIVDGISDMKASDDHTLVLTLAEGNADLPYQLSAYQLGIMPAGSDGKIDATSGIGSGPYVLKNYEPGIKAELVKFDDYWNDSVGHVATAEMLTVADVAARTNALTTGEVDVIDRLDVKTLHLLKRNKNLKILETSGNAHYTMPMHTDVGDFKNNDVRLALKYSIDREALLQTVLRGHGRVGNDHPIGQANRYVDNTIPQRTYDPDKAKFHLKKAGVSNLKVDLSAADAAFAGAVDAAVLYKEHAKKSGIEINVVREPNDGYWSNVWLKKPFCTCYWGGRPTEDWMFSTAYSKGAKWNDSHWENEKFNKTLIEARAELDEAKRAEMYSEMQATVSNDGGVIIPLFNNYIMASTNKVGQPDKMSGAWTMDGIRAVSRWWKIS